MPESADETLERLRAMSEGTYDPPPEPRIDLDRAALFAGLGCVTLEGTAVEIFPGIELRPTYAHVFAAPMVALSPSPNRRAPHPSPWYALEGGGDAETVAVEVALAEGAHPFGLPRLSALRLVASAIRLVSAQPVSMPLLCNVPLSDAKEPAGPVKMWRLERSPAIRGQPVTLSEPFNSSLRSFLPHLEALKSDGDLARAFSLADGMWWLPTEEAQMTTIWTVIEMLMRPGRDDTTKQLGRAVRSYIGFDRGSGDRLYQEVKRLYFARGLSTHAGAAPASKDVQDSFAILRVILLRALSERKRPPKPEDIVPLW